MKQLKTKRVGLALTAAERAALVTISERMGISLSAVMVVALRTMAEAMGVGLDGEGAGSTSSTS